MNDDRISSALQTLPREEAGPGFTAAVLQRIEEPPRRTVPRPWAMAAVAAAVLLALGLGWREWRHQQEQERAVAQLEVLLAEKQELEEELRSLRRLASQARPVVYLGGNERVDLVLDLARFQDRGGWPPDLATPAGRQTLDQRDTELRSAEYRPEERRTARRAVY